jgi:hypothetical protein
MFSPARETDKTVRSELLTAMDRYTTVSQESAVSIFRVDEDRGGTFLRNAGSYLPNHPVAHPRRTQS